jgi:hypothetical protein
MKSKEAIRNQILSYTNQIWGTRKVERLDSLVQLMINSLTNELYLIQNKLSDIDATLLEKIARRLTPEKYLAIRPAHTILQMKPEHSTVSLQQNNVFTLTWIADGLADRTPKSLLFSPVTDFRLYNAKIDNLFHFKQLYSVDNNAKKQLKADMNGQVRANHVWLSLTIDAEVKNLKGLSFYLDFPKLSEIHELYEMLPYTKCFINGKEIRLKNGLPLHKPPVSESDKDIVTYYNNHYLTIDEDVDISAWKTEKTPNILENIINPEQAESLKPKYWINLVFSPYFTVNMLKDMDIAVNVFPVSNYRTVKTSIGQGDLSKVTMLASEQDEKLLSIESIIDDKGRNLELDVVAGHSDAGIYHLEAVNNIFIEELGLVDYIEQLLSLIDEERAVFSEINKEQVAQALSVLTSNSNKEIQKFEINNKNKEETTSCLSINPHKETMLVNLEYRITYGDFINDISAGRTFTTDKSKKLEGLTATSLSEIHGGKEFNDIQDIMSVNRYIIASGSRLVTKEDIEFFCRSELGRAIEKVEVELGGKISPKPKEGLVRVLNVNLTPSKGNPELLYCKGVLKNLKMRMLQRSPDEYRYEIKIVE